MEITIHKKRKKKQPSNTKTANGLYEICSTLRGLIASWVTEKRCPLPLVDYFLEHEMVSQAECARWCASQPMRQMFESDGMSYPQPSYQGRDSLPGEHYWFFPRPINSFTYGWAEHDDVPIENLTKSKEIYGDTKEQCILNLLDAWKV